MRGYLLRLVRLIWGLFLYGLGVFLTVQANIGLAPWEAFGAGIANVTGLSLGVAISLTSLIVLGADCLLREKLGVGTILNAFLVGAFMDLIDYTGLIPVMQGLWSGLLMLVLGLAIICLASYVYMGTALGCGPRDALMVAVSKRLPRVPIGVLRTGIEGAVLLVGWLLGAKVGVGTVVSVFGIGALLQLVFRLLRFDAAAVRHENLLETGRNVRRLIRGDAPAEEPQEDCSGDPLP